MGMKAETRDSIEEIFPHCRALLDSRQWEETIAAWPDERGPDAFPGVLASQVDKASFIPDLARLEWAVRCASKSEVGPSPDVPEMSVNPSLVLLELSWRHLPLLIECGAAPEKGQEFVLVYRDAGTGRVMTRAAAEKDLLALKLLAENISPREAAAQGQVSVTVIETALDRAVRNGLLFAPASRIRRDPEHFRIPEGMSEDFLSVPVFTLQWHITQACDLHCKHCYDRRDRHALKLPQARRVLDDFYDFCKSRNVKGQVSFTGGNPLLYPHFLELYRAASDLGFSLAILGNPAPRKRMEEITAVETPAFYQVSLEGLRAHNDHVRGAGHFDRVMEFLGVLGELGIYAMVMLTLTRDNMDQVLSLAETLQGEADLFTFNRLSMVGEGANLRLPSKEGYLHFLERYLEAAKDNPIIGLKDNLFNILLHEKGSDLFGGCAGYGCGAAFNFMCVLPDGQAHACRKFPSPIGNVLRQGIAEVYDSDAAKRYRSGSLACRSCSIRPVCGGCLAVSHSFGLDIFEERDPFCFMNETSSTSR
jgi:selenobiotic family peptide radical SAM maturase